LTGLEKFVKTVKGKSQPFLKDLEASGTSFQTINIFIIILREINLLANVLKSPEAEIYLEW
jgi:hypothetical protein